MTLRKKLIIAIVVLSLVLSVEVVGTLAWLSDKTDPVFNTFTYGDINIKLDETDPETGNPDDDGENEYKMLPGIDIEKDPKVTVLKDSESNWLFVKLEKSANFDTFLTYAINDGWTQLKDAAGADVTGVYFRKVDMVTEEDGKSFYVLKDNTVTVKEDVTKEDLNNLGTDYPELTVTAYAVQYAGFEVKDANGNEQDLDLDPTLTNNTAFSAWQKVTAQEAANP